MGGLGAFLAFAGAAGLVVAFIVDSAAPGSQIAHLDKLLLAIASGSVLVAGSVLVGAGEVRQSIRAASKSSSAGQTPT